MGSKLTRVSWGVFWILLVPFCASANDTAATIGVGGLVLKKNRHIEMVSEVLEISVYKVRVTYDFLNTSSKDIKTTVAFPMPAFHDADDANVRPLDSFRTSVNGKEVAVKKHRRFLIGKVDVTDNLRKVGFTDKQIFDVGFVCWDTDPEDSSQPGGCKRTKKQMAAIALLHNSLKGNWAIQETAYWTQDFPAHKDIKVVHEYRPFAGYNSDNSHPGRNGCLDKATERLVDRRLDENGGVHVLLREVKYILGTGRNWRGPIRRFKLIIRKQAPNNVVTLCFPGKAVKTSPTTFEFARSNYVPQDMLDIFFYSF